MGFSGTFMLGTSLSNFSERKNHLELKTETKGDDIKEEIKYHKIRIISFQNKALKGHAEHLKENFNCALKEANNAKLSQKEEKDVVLDLQKRMEKATPKLATLKSSIYLNMQ